MKSYKNISKNSSNPLLSLKNSNEVPNTLCTFNSKSPKNLNFLDEVITYTFPRLRQYSSLVSVEIFSPGLHCSDTITATLPSPDREDGIQATCSVFLGLTRDSLTITSGPGYFLDTLLFISSDDSVEDCVIRVTKVFSDGRIKDWVIENPGKGFTNNSKTSLEVFDSDPYNDDENSDINIVFHDNEFTISDIVLNERGRGYLVWNPSSGLYTRKFPVTFHNMGSGIHAVANATFNPILVTDPDPINSISELYKISGSIIDSIYGSLKLQVPQIHLTTYESSSSSSSSAALTNSSSSSSSSLSSISSSLSYSNSSSSLSLSISSTSSPVSNLECNNSVNWLLALPVGMGVGGAGVIAYCIRLNKIQRNNEAAAAAKTLAEQKALAAKIAAEKANAEAYAATEVSKYKKDSELLEKSVKRLEKQFEIFLENDQEAFLKSIGAEAEAGMPKPKPFQDKKYLVKLQRKYISRIQKEFVNEEMQNLLRDIFQECLTDDHYQRKAFVDFFTEQISDMNKYLDSAEGTAKLKAIISQKYPNISPKKLEKLVKTYKAAFIRAKNYLVKTNVTLTNKTLTQAIKDEAKAAALALDQTLIIDDELPSYVNKALGVADDLEESTVVLTGPIDEKMTTVVVSGDDVVERVQSTSEFLDDLFKDGTVDSTLKTSAPSLDDLKGVITADDAVKAAEAITEIKVIDSASEAAAAGLEHCTGGARITDIGGKRVVVKNGKILRTLGPATKRALPYAEVILFFIIWSSKMAYAKEWDMETAAEKAGETARTLGGEMDDIEFHQVDCASRKSLEKELYGLIRYLESQDQTPLTPEQQSNILSQLYVLFYVRYRWIKPEVLLAVAEELATSTRNLSNPKLDVIKRFGEKATQNLSTPLIDSKQQELNDIIIKWQHDLTTLTKKGNFDEDNAMRIFLESLEYFEAQGVPPPIIGAGSSEFKTIKDPADIDYEFFDLFMGNM